jgi:hypothetical protein
MNIFDLAEKHGFQDDYGRWNFTVDGLLDFVFMVEKAEREECAKVCDRFIGTTKVIQAERIQSAIRARGIYTQPVDTVNTSQEHVDELKECVHEFFAKYLNHVEESDSGREFNPVTIGCCRALMMGPLNQLLERMRVLSGAKPNPCIDGAKVGEVGIWGDSQALAESANSTTGFVEPKVSSQTEQEPVVWLDEERKVFYWHNTDEVSDYHGLKRNTPLYTAPPKREWVGLTDEEMNELWVEYHGDGCIADGRIPEYEKAIEAKLKEKNT